VAGATFVSEALTKFMPAPQAQDAIQLLEPNELAKLELFAEELDRITQAATSKPIASVQEEGRAAELIARGVIAQKELESLRRKRVDPLNTEVRTVNAIFKRITDPLEALAGKGGRLERLILAFRAQERARVQRELAEAQRKQEEAARREAEALAKAEAAKSDKARQKALAEAEAASRAQTEALIQAPEPVTRGVRTDSGSVTEREVWTFEVLDAAQVPREYLVVSDAAIRKAVAAGVRQIPGVSIHTEERLTRRVG